MKRFLVLFTVIAMLLSCFASAEGFDPAGLLDWYDDEANYGAWLTVNNDHWNADIATAPTNEEIEAILDFATKAQTGINWTNTYFIVVRDPAAQQGIIGQSFGTLEGSANEGTVTILVLADCIEAPENHVSEYNSSYFQQPIMATYNAGLACGMLNVAAACLGYSTHYFAYPDGALINGAAHDMSYFLEGNEYTRLWGITGTLDDESTCLEYPVAGNCTFVAAIVLGTPALDEDVATHSTHYARPANYAFWD